MDLISVIVGFSAGYILGYITCNWLWFLLLLLIIIIILALYPKNTKKIYEDVKNEYQQRISKTSSTI